MALQQATEIWEQVRADTPDDVWLYHNAGLEYEEIDGPRDRADLAHPGTAAGDGHR